MAKLLVLTGTTRGLGRALVDRFVEQGWTVAGCGRTEGSVQELARQYPQSNRFRAVDVTSFDEVQAWANDVLEHLGPPDLLINNAASMNRLAPLWQLEPAEFSELTDINLNGVFNVIRAFVPAMVERRSGIIVNLSSGWGRSTSPDVAAYCGTKWGIEGLTRGLAQDLPKGMAAIPLNPGIINTDMLQSCFSEAASNYPTAEEWSRSAAPFLMGLTHRNNGQPLTVPGVPT